MYEEVLEKCKEWFYSLQILYSETIKTNIDVDDSKSFIANIDSVPKYTSDSTSKVTEIGSKQIITSRHL